MTTLHTSLNNQAKGHSLAQAFYKDAGIYRAEIDTIFFKHWLFAGHGSKIPNAGDFITLEFDNESVIVVRTNSGAIKAHANVCRHRGSRLCLDAQGSKSSFVCPYHAWRYSLDGDLVSARNMPDDFDLTSNGLHSVHTHLIDGLIFVCLAQEPPSLQAMHSDLDAILNTHGINDLKLAVHKTYEIPANWKLAVENYQECYHCAPSHREFAQIHAMAKSPESYATLKKEFWNKHLDDPKFTSFDYYFGLAKEGQEGYQYDRNPLLEGNLSGSLGGKAVAPLLGDIKSYEQGASELMIGPVTFFLLYDDHVVAYRFLPKGIDQCVCDIYWLVKSDAQEGVDYQLDQLTWLWNVTTQADKTIIVNNQKGVDSRYYQPGRLATMESFQQSFLDWYLDTLTRHAQ